jgi:hypothetical protein
VAVVVALLVKRVVAADLVVWQSLQFPSLDSRLL